MKAIFGATLAAFARRVGLYLRLGREKTIAGTLYTGGDAWYCLVPDTIPTEVYDPDDAGAHAARGVMEKITTTDEHLQRNGQHLPIHHTHRVPDLQDLALLCRQETRAWQDAWLRDTFLLFSSQEPLGRCVDMLLAHECREVSLALRGQSPYAYCLRVRNIPVYVALECSQWPRTKLFYNTGSPGAAARFVPWFTEYPLLPYLRFEAAGDPDALICIDHDEGIPRLSSREFQGLSAYLAPTIDARREPVQANTDDFRLSVEVTLKPCDQLQTRELPLPELWIVPPEGIDLFMNDLYCPESRLNQWDGCVVRTKGGGPLLAVWTGGREAHGETVPFTSLAGNRVQTFYRSPRAPSPLMLPADTILFPTLEPATIASCFDLEERVLTVLRRTDEGLVRMRIPQSSFKPLRSAMVDYHAHVHAESIETNVANVLYDFGEPRVYESAPVRDAPTPPPPSSPRAAPPGGPDSGPAENHETPPEEPTEWELETGADSETQDTADEQPRNAETGEPDRILTPEERFDRHVREAAGTFPPRESGQWRRYCTLAAFAHRPRDSFDALGWYLLCRPRSGVMDTVCEVLGMPADWFWTKPPGRLFEAIFAQDEYRLPEQTLFRLYAARDRLIRNAHILSDHAHREKLRGLYERIRQSGNPVVAWLYARITHQLTGDTTTIDEARLRVQEMIREGEASRCIPVSMRALFTGRAYPRYATARDRALKRAGVAQSWRLWIPALESLCLILSDRFALPGSALENLRKRCAHPAYRPVPDRERERILAFISSLEDMNTCTGVHPSLCTFSPHGSGVIEPALCEIIDRLCATAQPGRSSGELDPDADHATDARQSFWFDLDRVASLLERRRERQSWVERVAALEQRADSAFGLGAPERSALHLTRRCIDTPTAADEAIQSAFDECDTESSGDVSRLYLCGHVLRIARTCALLGGNPRMFDKHYVAAARRLGPGPGETGSPLSFASWWTAFRLAADRIAATLCAPDEYTRLAVRSREALRNAVAEEYRELTHTSRSDTPREREP